MEHRIRNLLYLKTYQKTARRFSVAFSLAIIICLLFTSCSKSVEVQIKEQLDLGQKYLAEMNYEQAVIAFSKIIELDEKNIQAYEGLGSAYMAQKKYSEAGTAYRKIVELDDTNISAYQNLAHIYDSANEDEEAIGVYKKLIDLDGSSWAAYEGAARAYERSGRIDEAIAIAEIGLEKADVSEEGKSYVISLYYLAIEDAENNKDYAKVLEYCQKIQELDSYNNDSNNKLADLREKQARAERIIQKKENQISTDEAVQIIENQFGEDYRASLWGDFDDDGVTEFFIVTDMSSYYVSGDGKICNKILSFPQPSRVGVRGKHHTARISIINDGNIEQAYWVFTVDDDKVDLIESKT